MTSPSGNQDSPTGALTSLARDLLDGRQDADDVAQDVWLLLGRQSPGRVRSLRSWLSIAIRHVAVRSRQRDRRRAERERIVARPDHAPSVLDQLERKSQQELLTSLVNGLAEPYREVVRLRYLEDREVEEIAADLGRSAATVRSQVKRGLDQLRARMGAERRRRRGLAVLLPWLRRRTRELATAARPAFVLGGATVALLLGVLVVSGGSRREQRIVSAAPARARDWPPDLVPVATAGRSAVAPETASDLGVLLTAGEDASADVQGFVLGPDGKGVAGARILVGDRRGSEASVAARSDAQGHYRIEGVDRQDLIWAEDEERVPSQRHVVGSNPRDGLDLLVGHPSGTLVGRVLWDGRPVPRAEVQLIAAPPRFESTEQGTLALDPPPVRVWTDAGGSFRLGLPLQQNFRLFVQADGHAPLIEFLTRDVEVPVELTLPIPNFLEGRLMRPDGTPAAGARVELVFPPPLPERRTTTDGVGVFRFELLPPGALALRAQEDSAGPSPSCFWEGELAPSDRWLDLTLREEHTLRGRALDGDAPIAGWTVELEELDDMFIRAPRRIETAPDGGFEFPACSLTGRHALRLLEPDDGSGAACAVACEARAGSAPLILRPKEGRLHPGSLALSFEAPALELRPMIVTLHDGSLSKPPWLLANADAGAFSAPRVAAGRHRLRAWIPGIGLLDAGEVTIDPGRHTEHVARVPPPGSLHVRIAPVEDDPWDDWTVMISIPALHPDTWAMAKVPKATEPGSFAIELLPGEYAYKLMYRGDLYEYRSVRIESDTVTENTALLAGPVPMTIRLSFDRPLQIGESMILSILGTGRERTVEIPPKTTGRSQAFRVVLDRETRELRARSVFGLSGRIAVTAEEIVPEGELGLELGGSAND